MHKIFFIVIMLLAFCFNGVAVAGTDKDKKAGAGSMAHWVGSYESVSGRCGDLLVQESRITWGSCKDATAELVSVTKSELVMKVDPAAQQCGWAGFIVVLGNEGADIKPKADGKLVKVISAYQSQEDYKAGNRFVQCSFFKKEQ